MSTDHQQYSLDNQAEAIARYAADHGFRVVKTYSDAAKSGLRLKNRTGLKQLLKDVVQGQKEFRAVLVYDVSRWGRFQDSDEAAHYEYTCKSAGVPVHYCVEMFDNEGGGPLALIMKALKRIMAAEYSRDLSVKVRTGQLRLARLGYKLGGRAPYGLRRLLLDKHDHPKQQLAFGERKSLANEHVTFVPGPRKEQLPSSAEFSPSLRMKVVLSIQSLLVSTRKEFHILVIRRGKEILSESSYKTRAILESTFGVERLLHSRHALNGFQSRSGSSMRMCSNQFCLRICFSVLRKGSQISPFA
jgi:DNA invertase Pin-like site-specific DNA recombinase